MLQIQNSPGTSTTLVHSMEIIFLLVGAFILGWLLYHFIFGLRQKKQMRSLERDLKKASEQVKDLETDLEGCNAAVINVKGENASLSTQLTKLRREISHGGAGMRQTKVPGEKEVLHSSVHPDTVQASISMSDTSTRKRMEESDSDTKIPQDDSTINNLASEIAGSMSVSFDAEKAKAVFGRRIEEDDLKIVEGVGSKSESLLNEYSIHTWRQLGNTSVPQLQHILDSAGGSFALLNPSTWPKQARMASESDWVKLREYQEYLVGGVEPGMESPSTSSQSNEDLVYFKGKPIKMDDLTLIEGIGQKIEPLLKEAGIVSWKILSETSTDDLENLLEEAGDPYRDCDPSTWPNQAALAFSGAWQKLEEFQYQLTADQK